MLVLGVMVFAAVLPGIVMGFEAGQIGLAAWMIAWAFFGLALLRDRRAVDDA